MSDPHDFPKETEVSNSSSVLAEKIQALQKKMSKLVFFLIVVIVLQSLALAGTLFFFSFWASQKNTGNSQNGQNLANFSVFKTSAENKNSLQSNQNPNLNGSSQAALNLTPFQFQGEAEAKSSAQVIEESLPAVLSIFVRQKSQNGLDLSIVEAGTGSIISKSGLVLTNKHVVARGCGTNGSDVQITASNFLGEVFDLQLLAVDPIEDIALLKIVNKQGDFPFLQFASSDKIGLGSEVLAIGNVMGQLEGSVSRGVISGLNRSLPSPLPDECTGTNIQPSGLLQTDAAINKGNSGGPLLNSSGLILGMNTFATSSVQNVALATSSQTILKVLNIFQERGKIVRPVLGVVSKPLNAFQKKQNPWLPVDWGEIIYSDKPERLAVSPDSEAAKAGLKGGDILLEVAGQKVYSQNNSGLPLKRLILDQKVGEEVEILVWPSTNILQTQGDIYEYEKAPKTIKIKLSGLSFNFQSGEFENN